MAAEPADEIRVATAPLATISRIPANSIHSKRSSNTSQPITVAKITPRYCRLAVSSVRPRPNARVIIICPADASAPMSSSGPMWRHSTACQPVNIAATAPNRMFVTANQKTTTQSGSPRRLSVLEKPHSSNSGTTPV